MVRKIKPVFRIYHPIIFNCCNKHKPVNINDFKDAVEGIDEAEFGFGKGRFILKRAEENPDRTFIAVEAVSKIFMKTLAKASERGLSNLYLVLGDARLFLSLYLRQAQLDSAYFLFPDPWHKSKQQKHRMISEKTVPYITSLLKDTGKLVIRSDNYIVLFDIFRNLMGSGLKLQTLEWNDNPVNALTEWESKAIIDGRRILHAVFVKPAGFTNSAHLPLFDDRQISFRQFIDDKFQYFNSVTDENLAEINALKVPDNLLL
ncbi:MAG: hypothetical protein K8S87_05285 [Planctomycetes bacterium]|nr:hypothetical protein [Planctomycetota bacterium]